MRAEIRRFIRSFLQKTHKHQGMGVSLLYDDLNKQTELLANHYFEEILGSISTIIEVHGKIVEEDGIAPTPPSK